MRYLSLFFIFLSLHSYVVFAADQPLPSCATTTGLLYCNGPTACAEASNSCLSAPKNYFKNEGMLNQFTVYRCQQNCICPPGSTWFNHYDTAGNATAGCASDGGGENPSDDCSGGQQKVYDPVSGTMVCPGSGDPSSSVAAASSQRCVIPGDYDGDCVPDDEQSSSTPTSSPDTTSAGSNTSGTNTSSGGGGDDDGGGTPGGGGGDGGNGGNNGGGGGSAAASSLPSGSNSSWTHHTGYGNWIPVSADSNCPNKFKDTSGQWWCAGSGSPNASSSPAMAVEGSCDYTSKDYFYCITSGNGSNTSAGGGSNSSWTPVSGYGNWIPVGEDSPCPNKFKDASGKWWCAGGSTGGGSGSGGGTGTASSGGAAGSAAAGECDQTASNYLDCISQGKTSSRSSGSAGSASSASSTGSASSTSSKSGAFSSLGDKGEFDGEDAEKALEDLEEELTKKIADIKADIQGEFGGSVSGSGTMQDFCSNIRGSQVCFGMKKFEQYLDPISQAIFLVACFLSFAIVLRK